METGHIAGRLTTQGTRTSVPVLPGIATAGGGFQAAAAGSKRYGLGQIAPQRGVIADRTGYVKRNTMLAARREALARAASSHIRIGGN